jgi:hypothetical protein
VIFYRKTKRNAGFSDSADSFANCVKGMVIYDDFTKIGTAIFTAGEIITAEDAGIESTTAYTCHSAFAATDLLFSTGGGSLWENRQGTYPLLR